MSTFFISIIVLVVASVQVSGTVTFDNDNSRFPGYNLSLPLAVKERDEFSQDLLFRLPRSVIPTRYKLEIIPILDEIPQFPRFTVQGKVWIRVNCTEATSVIKLHALALNIDEASVYVQHLNGEYHAIRNFENQTEFDFFIINLLDPLTTGEMYEIFIAYTAPIARDRLDGFYLDSYVNPITQQTRYVATTLFAATNARRAFPCMDEPEFKAEFEIVLGRAADYHALSNMHVVDTQPMSELPGWSWVMFAPTPKMSTYLVCMIISDLTYEEAASSDPNATIHRVYAPYYFIDRGGGKYSANLSMTVLNVFESYYNLSYPLKKLDNVALPQFYYNAMENFGLMTYADRVLIYFEGETSEAQKYQLSLTVSHEVSHNFFGNIVTCKWWSYVYLNEGWATFASHLGLEKTYPEFRPWEQFIPNIYQVAMEADASLSTHPVVNEPLTPADIGGIYDDIAYEKGASLIRMMESFLTETILQIGVQQYLQLWKYNVAEQDNLFEELQKVVNGVNPSLLPSGISVKDIMDTWTMQSGYPLITVSRINSAQIMFSQKQFVNNGIPSGNETWWVPLSIQIITGSNPGIQTMWMSKDRLNMTYSLADTELFFVNPESIGYYRVQYADELVFQNIASILKENHHSLSPVMRMKFLDDNFVLASAGLQSIESAMSLTSYIEKETDFLVWKTIRSNIGKMCNQFRGTTYGDYLAEYVLSKIQSVEKIIGQMGKSQQTFSKNMLREELKEWKVELLSPSGNTTQPKTKFSKLRKPTYY